MADNPLLSWLPGMAPRQNSLLDNAPMYYPPEARTASPEYVPGMRSVDDMRGQVQADLAGETLGGRTVIGFGQNPATVAKATRGMAAVPSLRGRTPEDALALARPEPHLIQGQGGQYVGAPRGMTMQQQITDMRSKFDADVAAGIEGGDWYVRARKWIEEVAGGDPQKQKLMANELALWSAQADPGSNLQFALQGHNAYERGLPLETVRTGQQAGVYNTARAERDAAMPSGMGHNGGPALDDLPPGVPKLGPKTGVYGQNLDPGVPFSTTGTNDIWHARGFGYQGDEPGKPFARALTGQEHTFLDYETLLAVERANAQRLGGRSDWTAHEIQAAPWVAGKARGLEERFDVSPEEGMRRASATYPDYAAGSTAHSTHEQIPGASTGLLPELIDAPMPEKQAFTNRSTWQEPGTGRDIIHSDMGLYNSPSRQGIGAYESTAGQVEFNPSTVSRVLVDNAVDPATGKTVTHSGTRAALTGGEAVRGLVDFQEGAPWNRLMVGRGDETSLGLRMGRMPSEEEMRTLHGIAGRRGYFLANADDGVNLLQANEAATPTTAGKQLRGGKGDPGMRAELEQAAPGARVVRGKADGDYVDYGGALASANAGEGKATQIMLDKLAEMKTAAPRQYEALLDSEGISGKARENLLRLREYGGAGQREDYEELLRLVGTTKLRGLVARISRLGTAGLPAAGAVGLGLGSSGEASPTARE